jgi:N6-L-threonylcarbamoyladenine synthase
VGVNAAKSLSLSRNIPLVGVNHLEGHIYANWLVQDEAEKPALSQAEGPVLSQAEGPVLSQAEGPEGKAREPAQRQPSFPLICLIVSGGHSDLVLMKGHGDYTLLGRTRDDAAGEAFDKAARILDLGYPGGPAIQKAAGSATPAGMASIQLPHAWLKGTNDFSFSGIKTALLRHSEAGRLPVKPEAAAAFQEAVVEVLTTKTIRAAIEYRVKMILVAGGVAANARLRQKLLSDSPLPVLIPPLKLCTDNAAMIAACGFFRFQAGKVDSLDLDVLPGLRLG